MYQPLPYSTGMCVNICTDRQWLGSSRFPPSQGIDGNNNNFL